jgi:hypothetical protein
MPQKNEDNNFEEGCCQCPAYLAATPDITSRTPSIRDVQ